MRVFIEMKQLINSQSEILKRLDQLEQKTIGHDKNIQSIFEAIRQLLGFQEKEKKKRIGF